MTERHDFLTTVSTLHLSVYRSDIFSSFKTNLQCMTYIVLDSSRRFFLLKSYMVMVMNSLFRCTCIMLVVAWFKFSWIPKTHIFQCLLLQMLIISPVNLRLLVSWLLLTSCSWLMLNVPLSISNVLLVLQASAFVSIVCIYRAFHLLLGWLLWEMFDS